MSTPAVASTRSVATQRAPAQTTTAKVAPPRRVTPPNPCHDDGAGALAQLAAVPTSNTDCFRAKMAALWDGIRHDSQAAARPAFFPEGAYLRLKTIGDPQGDYQGRLLGDYSLDIGAAHALLGAHPAQAQLLAVNVPGSYAHWVPPGVCDNSAGYYEVAHARVVYRADGQVRSFGIASMISWRGLWYVIHLGAILRSADAGVVDDPEIGAGVSAPSGTC